MLKRFCNSIVFGSGFVVLVISIMGIHAGSIFNWTAAFIFFVLLPLIDFLFPQLKLEANEIPVIETDFWLMLVPPSLTILILYSGYQYQYLTVLSEKIGLVISVGSLTGALGITAAHELIHRKQTWQRALGVWILQLVNFAHWGIEHVFGHHKNVGTPDDHASATKGQTLYQFWFADYFGGLINAFRFERKRLVGKKFSFFRNRIANYFIVSTVVSIFLLFLNAELLIFWWSQSLVAIVLLLSVDYIEHYGLRRIKKESGQFEPVSITHSWDTQAFLTNALFFNLGLHSHHHMKARAPFQELRIQQGSKDLPFGYAGMVILAFAPPLFFKKMDPLI